VGYTESPPLKLFTTLLVVASAILLTGNAAASPDLSQYERVFEDDFNGSQLDASKWNTGFLWGPYLQINNEQQLYVDTLGINANSLQENGGQTPNPFSMTGNSLKIVSTPVTQASQIPARPPENDPIWSSYPEYRYNESYDPADIDYLSGTITSYDAFRFAHGYAEARVKLPAGQGLWPAFWLLTSFYVEDVPEIDIMEFLGHDKNTAYHTYHYFEPQNGWNLVSTPSYKSTSEDFTDGWNTFGVSWDSKSIVWYVNGVEARRITDQEYTIPNQAMYVIANTAVGGNWPGSPDSSTPFPVEYEIDYIHVYKKKPPNTITPSTLASDYHLMFEDNFNGNSLDTQKWNTHHLWGPYWQINAEQQFYPDVGDTHAGETYNTAPITVGGGTLKITADAVTAEQLPDMPAVTSGDFQAHREWRHNDAYNNPDFNNPPAGSQGHDPSQANEAFLPGYTSGILTTYDSFKFTHGYAEIRARLPLGDGLWPAFWLLNGYYVDQQPEIDIMEFRGEAPQEIVHSYHHSPRNGETPSYSWSTFSNNQQAGYTDGFHLYGASWEPGKIDFYIDGVKVHTHTGTTVSTQNMYAILNLAVGGNFNYADVDESIFPVSFEIDHVRIYQLEGAGPSAQPEPDTEDPTANITNLSDGDEIESTNSFVLEGSYSDNQSGVDWLLARIQRLGVSPAQFWNGSDWTETVSWESPNLDGSGTWNLTGVNFEESGNYRIVLMARDNAGNLATANENPTTNLTVSSSEEQDTEAPIVDLTLSTSGGQITATSGYEIQGSYSDNQSGVNWVGVRIQRLRTSPAVFWNGSDWSTAVSWQAAELDRTGEWSLNNIDFSEKGLYRILLMARDNAGNLATSGNNPITNIEVLSAADNDTEDPVIQTTIPSDSSQITTTDEFAIEGTYTDDLAGVDWIRVRIQRLNVSPAQFWNGSDWTETVSWPFASLDGPGNWSLENVDFTTPGAYRILLLGRDNAGNLATGGENPSTDVVVN